MKSILQPPRLALRCHEHVAQLRRSAAADPVDPVGHGTILCSGFTLVVNLFNKDDAEDGGLSFFILQKHRAQIIWTHVSLLHSGSR